MNTIAILIARGMWASTACMGEQFEIFLREEDGWTDEDFKV